MPALCGETPAGAIWEQLCPVKTQGSSARGQTRLRKQRVDASLQQGGTRAVSGPGVSKQGGWAPTPWPQQPRVVSAPSPHPRPRLPSAVLCLPERAGNGRAQRGPPLGSDQGSPLALPEVRMSTSPADPSGVPQQALHPPRV
ncbi:protein enabled homolog isoform X1 [Bubalus bubalis]|uniref:protein enabled homolog isoform X1 n=1 Tax=Bubalus bubalis TaxID=89462 RepID=UPI001E1B92ED|nr:protein enabled homolog isoform X1 [Bubalus bubalis]